MEVPDLNAGKFYILYVLLYRTVTVLLEYLNPLIYSCLVFAIVVNAIYFKPQKV